MPAPKLSKYFGRLFTGRAGNSSPPPDKNDLKLIPGNELPSQLDAWWWLVGAVALVIVLLMVI